MRSAIFSFFCAVALSLTFAVAANAQVSTFSNENVEYTFDLPNDTWKILAEPSKIKPNAEYVYGDRLSGYFEVRKLAVKDDSVMSDIIADEETKLKFIQGYIAGKEEPFSGKLRGTVFNYEFLRSGRNMSGRIYFLKADATTVYTVRFTGLKEKLIAIRNQTDSIARTFQVKKD
ncbi:MAG: hypothetical protein IPN69_07090 [Acidobacteria bacterium]|nr:hypothetical protein [Acidobacteriota bacterium]MBK8147306.1 hypothetical protein [Acidobacteriota bacterium]MBK8810488.1 hypothetical protein [Acidobacteriota bacterium]